MRNPALVIQEWKKALLEANLAVPALILGLVLFIVVLYLQRRSRQRQYILETLKANRLANENTAIVRNGIKNPNKASDDWKLQNSLICELFRDSRIIDFIYRDHLITFKRAKFPKSVKVEREPKLTEIGVDQDNKRFAPQFVSLLCRAYSRGGKTILINNIIYSEFLFRKRRRQTFKIIIADLHGSFAKLQGIDEIEIFDLRTVDGKKAFLARLYEIQKYQQSVDLSNFETLAEAQQNGFLTDRSTFTVLIDEFQAALGNTVGSKDPETSLNQQIIKQVEGICTGGAKYSQRVAIFYQLQTNAGALISPNIFLGEIVNWMPPELAQARGASASASHPLLKEAGNFLFSSKVENSRFFRTAFISKADLPDLIRGSHERL